MKKKFFLMAVIAILISITILHIYKNNHGMIISDLALSNVEALANNEGDFEVVCGRYSGDCWKNVGICFDGEYTLDKCTFDGGVFYYCKGC